MKKGTKEKLRVGLCAILIVMLLSSCSAFNGLLNEVKIQHPQVSFVGAKLSGLSFDAANLMFDLKISNPNAVGLKMAGFDYNFLINGNSFLKGDQGETLEIAAQGSSIIHLPLSLSYTDLYQTFQSLRKQDVSAYQLKCGFSFDVPVLGKVDIPVSKSGEFPLLKLPKLKVTALKLKGVTLSGADLVLKVRMDNPNAFSMLLEKIQYRFEVNGQDWVSGYAEEAAQVAEKGQGIIEIPISLKLFQMGKSIRELLAGDKALNYKFGGKLDIAASLPLLGKTSLPFDYSDTIKLIR